MSSRITSFCWANGVLLKSFKIVYIFSNIINDYDNRSDYFKRSSNLIEFLPHGINIALPGKFIHDFTNNTGNNNYFAWILSRIFFFNNWSSGVFFSASARASSSRYRITIINKVINDLIDTCKSSISCLSPWLFSSKKSISWVNRFT